MSCSAARPLDPTYCLRMLNPLVLMPCPDFSTHTKSISVVDGFLIRDKILHRLDLLRGVSLPIQILIHDPKRVLGAIGLCRITRKLSVGHIGIIHERPRRFYHVDPARAFALCQFRSPRSREHGLAEVDPWRSPLRVVGGIAALKHVPWLQVRLGAMVERS